VCWARPSVVSENKGQSCEALKQLYNQVLLTGLKFTFSYISSILTQAKLRMILVGQVLPQKKRICFEKKKMKRNLIYVKCYYTQQEASSTLLDMTSERKTRL
jgi:hypothetical protein